MIKPLELMWGTCGKDQHWCDFFDLQLPLKNDPEGVYIIWLEGLLPATVRVGQGNITERLRVHRRESKITDYSQQGVLKVTWATVPERLRGGIEAFLEDTLAPLVGERFPEADPNPVNLPSIFAQL